MMNGRIKLDPVYNIFIILLSPGLANICMFRTKASDLFRIVEDEGDNTTSQMIAKQIVQEVKEIKVERTAYNTRIDKHSAIKDVRL